MSEKRGRRIRCQEVREITGLRGKQPHVKGNDLEDDFPAPYQIGPHSVAWDEDEIIVWNDSRPRTVQKRVQVQPVDGEADNAEDPLRRSGADMGAEHAPV